MKIGGESRALSQLTSGFGQRVVVRPIAHKESGVIVYCPVALNGVLGHVVESEPNSCSDSVASSPDNPVDGNRETPRRIGVRGVSRLL